MQTQQQQASPAETEGLGAGEVGLPGSGTLEPETATKDPFDLPTFEEVYPVHNSATFRLRSNKQRGTYLEKLANFSARIEREIVVGDGPTPIRLLEIRGTLQDGTPLPLLRLRDDELLQIRRWVLKYWGTAAIIGAASGAAEHLLCAIQQASVARQVLPMLRSTGWHEIGGRRLFVHAHGVVGMAQVLVELPEALACVCLPPVPQDPARAMRASVEFLHVAQPQITAALWAGQYLAPLATFGLPVEAVLWLHGPTGSRKTSLALAASSHFGPRRKVDLPQLFSTGNSLEKLAYLAKDTVLVLDDYPPETDPLASREMAQTLGRLVRGVGNQGGRARLDRQLELQPTFYPRGLLIGTAEHTPALSQGALARMFKIAIGPDDIDNQVLQACQELASQGIYAQAMSAYLAYLVRHQVGLDRLIREAFEDARHRAHQAGQHLRLPQVVAALYVAAQIALDFALDCGAVLAPERLALLDSIWQALLDNAHETDAEIADADPARRALDVLLTAVVTGSRRLEPRLRDGRCLGGGTLLGFYDTNFVYVLKEAAIQLIVEAERRKGRIPGIQDRELIRAWAQQGYIEATNGRNSVQVRISEGGMGDNRRLCLRFKLDAWTEVLAGVAADKRQ